MCTSFTSCHNRRVYNSNVVDLQYLFICTNLFVNLVIVFKRFCLFLFFYLDKWFSVHPFSSCVFPLSSVWHQPFCFLQPWSPARFTWLSLWESSDRLTSGHLLWTDIAGLSACMVEPGTQLVWGMLFRGMRCAPTSSSLGKCTSIHLTCLVTHSS